jgi:hypothetical protein
MAEGNDGNPDFGGRVRQDVISRSAAAVGFTCINDYSVRVEHERSHVSSKNFKRLFLPRFVSQNARAVGILQR